MKTSRFTCARCGPTTVRHHDISTGYAVDGRGRKICFPCCADVDRAFMDRHGRIALYLTMQERDRGEVTNWPGTLRFVAYFVREGRHNLAGIRRDAWFTDHRGHRWHGVQYGRWSQILHARRLAS